MNSKAKVIYLRKGSDGALNLLSSGLGTNVRVIRKPSLALQTICVKPRGTAKPPKPATMPKPPEPPKPKPPEFYLCSHCGKKFRCKR